MNEYSQRNIKHYFLTSAILFILVACRMGTIPVQPTLRSSPMSLPIQPTVIPYSTISPKSEVIIPEPQFDETPPEKAPEESIWIQSPENGAKISGILTVQGISDPTFEQNLVIRLVDQNNTEILRTNTIIQADTGSRGNFSTAVNIPATTSQTGILQVFSVSPKDGSLVHLSSVVVLLNSEDGAGSPINRNERILVYSIRTNGAGSDAVIEVTGVAWGLFENSLNYTICGEKSGNIPDLVCGTLENRLMEGAITTNANEMGLPGDFTISIRNTLSLPQSASLVIYSISPMNGAIDHAASHPLFGYE